MTAENSPPEAGSPGKDEINRLHAGALKLSTNSSDALHAALVAAWKAG